MRSYDELESYDEEQERAAEFSRRLQEERQERLDTLRYEVSKRVTSLWEPTIELARMQAKLEARVYHGVFTTIALLDRFADAAKAVADSATAAAIAARQQGVELELIEAHVAENE
jgi:hypothetical protein